MRHFFCVLRARFRHFLRFPDVIYLQPTPLPSNVVASHLPRILVCVRVFVRVRVHICVLEKRKKNGVDADSAGREVLHEHAVVVAMLIIFTESLFLFIYYCLPIFITLSLILSSAFHMYLFTFYGSFCSIPRQLLLRRGFVTINLLVFLFTE